ncbi:hypothetical protein LguiA_004332 [Lonicera macranthoides]
MDQFDVLVESIGFKSQGRSSTPIADLKGKTGIKNGLYHHQQNLGKTNSKSSSMNSSSFDFNSSFVDDLDGIFRSTSNSRKQETSNSNGFDDLFGVPNLNSKPSDNGSMFDLDSVFKGSSNLGTKTSSSPLYDGVDDIFGGIAGSNKSTSVNYDNVFGNVASSAKKSDGLDDLFGSFGGMGSKSNGLSKNSGFNSDDLIPGFRLRPPPNGRVKGKQEKVPVEQRVKEKEKPQRRNEQEKEAPKVDLESFFGMDAPPSHLPRSRSTTTTEDSMFDTLFQKRDALKVERTSSWTSMETKKASNMTNIADDFSFFFEMGGGPSSGDFQEIEGESEERRRARLKHHKNTQQRMARALDEKNQRDLKTHQEQEERHRLSETLDDGIKRWATGKEGNLRALLSSLQYVLWPECGWQPVSLTDLITSTSVKKVYYKATLCVHPDKVQQKGASLQQKYIAEKVFDLLKEAWNKFNKEEL